jgi:hypothetical protein
LLISRVLTLKLVNIKLTKTSVLFRFFWVRLYGNSFFF